MTTSAPEQSFGVALDRPAAPPPGEVEFIAHETRPAGVGSLIPAVKLPSAAILAGS